MSLFAALIYWVIVCIWSAVLVTVAVAFARYKRTLGTGKLLLIVVTIDTARNIVENVYFGAYFGSQYGVFPIEISGILGQPFLLIVPKLLNVVAATIVLLLLVFRWLPLTQREKARAERAVRNTSEALRREVEEHRRLFETSVDLIVVTDRQRLIQRISRSCEAVLGYDPNELINRYGGEFVIADDLDLLRDEMEAAVASASNMRNFECRFRHKDGHLVPIGISGVWSEEAERFFLIGRDMTSAKATSAKLAQLAHFDPLTGLPNRISLVDDLNRHLSTDCEGSVAVIIFDLDGFKDVNDSLGHSFGDALLRQIPERLSSRAPDDARVYRLGGDEFVVVLPGRCDVLDVDLTAAKILEALQYPFEIDSERIVIGASAGMVTALRDGADADDLLASADLALYAAKSQGRGQARLYLPVMRSSAYARLEINKELRRAVTDREFVLYFQPQFRLSDGALVGLEALLRWNHPDRGILAPNVFIDALANGPYANEIGDWILDTACAAVAKWRVKSPGLRVAVNLFPCQFAGGLIAERVNAVLNRWQLPPEALELELTENVVLGSDANFAALQALRDLGVQIAFDDFGTGYASLSCIATYPITRIKIDRSFVRDIEGDSSIHDTAIASTIIVLAHNLGLSVTAEGVETRAQESFLRAKHCNEVQGFRYARPLPPNDVERLFATDLEGERHSA